MLHWNARPREDAFHVFVTVDKNLQFQQNLATLPVAVLVLDAASNELQALLPLLPRLERVLGSVKPKTLAVVSAA